MMRLSSVLCAALAILSVTYAAPKHPHVIFIVADDLGFDDVGFRSHQINTPNIDGFAKEGIILENYHVQSVCSPSRAAFQTGRYPVHTTIYDWIHPDATYGLPLNETTLGDKFHEAGYNTHAVGKWHLGFFQWEYTPTFRGYESFTGFYSGGEDYFSHETSSAYDFRHDPSWKCGANCSTVASNFRGNYSTNVFANAAVERVMAHDASNPFFLYLAFQAVHAPAEVPAWYEQPYVNKIASKRRRTFAGMLSAMDEGIGNVTKALKAKGMLEDSLIVFTTDNGGPTTTGDGVGSSNWPLRGGKHTVWDGGVRGTAVIWGQGLQKTEYTYNGMMHGVDWLPTLVTAAGLSPGGTLPLDGVDQWQALLTNGSSPRTEVFLGNNDDNTPESWAIKVGDWKLLQWGGGNPDTWLPPDNYSVSVSADVDTCTTVDGWAFPGNTIDGVPPVHTANPGDCCTACLANAKCMGWTFQPDQTCPGESANGCCYLKNGFQNGKFDGNVTSGSGHGTLPPMAKEWQLYHTASDPGEHFEVSDSNPEIVASLKAKLLEVYNNRVPLIPDGNCPKVTHPVDPVVGPVWAPWC